MDRDEKYSSSANDLESPSTDQGVAQEIDEARLVELLGSPLRVRSRVVAVDRILQGIERGKSDRADRGVNASSVDFDRQFDKTYCDDYDRVYSQSMF
jgi:hypothetical protein